MSEQVNQHVFDSTQNKSQGDFIVTTVRNILVLNDTKYGDVTLRNGKEAVVVYRPRYGTWFPTLRPKN